MGGVPSRSHFDRYIGPDGRVARLDQGGDTVSEGQAYGLLVAVAEGDRSKFKAVWTWTASHLQRPDGLLSYHWVGGAVADPMPASDADLDAAWALALAATRFGDRSYAALARRMAGAILDNETVATLEGTVLTAGPWATKPPVTLNPSYFSPEAFAALHRLSGDQRWKDVSASSARVLGDLRSGGGLPPDWAVLGPATATPAPAPQPGSVIQYGLDAERAPVWYGAACLASDRAIAAGWWRQLSASGGPRFAISSDLTGVPTTDLTNPLGAVAAAAAAAAAGERSTAATLLVRSEALDDAHPTYYGAAWLTLGETLLRTSVLGSCPSL